SKASAKSTEKIKQVLTELTPVQREAVHSLPLIEETGEADNQTTEQKQSEAEKGIDYIAADPPAYTTAVEVGYNGLRWSVDLLFQLKSPMSTMDVFLVDAQTNEEIGFLGTMDGGGADPYKEYIYRGIMNEGRYY